MVEASSVLEGALFPVTPADFFATHWRRKALAVVPRSSPAARRAAEVRLGPITSELFDLDLDELLANTASERIFAWMRESAAVGGASPPANGATDGVPLRSFEVESASAAAAVHACGGSLYFRAPPSFCEEWVAEASAQLGLGPGARHPSGELRGEVELFASRAGHVTDWHFDFMENITFQLRGSKTWRLHGGGPDLISEPARGATPHYARAGNLEQQLRVHRLQAASFALDGAATAALAAGAESVTLTAGSVLYFPAGMWHRVECGDDDSLSLNLSLIGLAYAELVGDASRQLALAHAPLRSLVAAPPAGGRASAAARLDAARAECERALAAQRAALAGLCSRDLLPDCYFLQPPCNGSRGKGAGGLAGTGFVDVLAEEHRLAPASAVGGNGGESANGAARGAGRGAKRKKGEAAAAATDNAAVLRLNPLAVLVSDRSALGEIRRALEQEAAATEEEEEEEGEEEGSSEGEGNQPVPHRASAKRKRGVGGSGGGSSDSEGGSGECSRSEEVEASEDGDGGSSHGSEAASFYALSLNFGGEDLHPHCRTVLAVPPDLEPFLDWLALVARTRCNACNGREAERAATPELGVDGAAAQIGRAQSAKAVARVREAIERSGSEPQPPHSAHLGMAEVEARARALGLTTIVARQVLRVLIFHGYASRA